MWKFIPEKFRTPALALAAAIIAAAIYLPSLNAPFVYDDAHSIKQNPSILGGAPWSRFFTDPSTFSVNPNMRMYRPLTLLSYAINYKIAGTRVGAWHLFSILFHTMNAALLFFIALKIVGNRQGAFVAALVWAIHPLGSEAVIYQAARSNLMATTAVLAGFYLYVSSQNSKSRLAASVAVFTLGLLCKETAVVLPILLLWYDANRSEWKNIRWKKYVPYAAVLAVYIICRMTLLRLETFDVAAPVRSVWENLLSQSGSVMLYIKEIFWPAGLSIEHDFKTVASFGPAGVPFWRWPLFAIPAIAAIVVSTFLLRRKAVAWSFGAAWFFISLAPESSIIPLVQIANERRAYLPLAGIAIAAGALTTSLTNRRGAASGAPTKVVIAILLCCLAALTIYRETQWRTPERLWMSAIKQAPDSVVALHGLASVEFNEKGNFTAAEPLYRRIIKLDPSYYGAHLGLGRLLLKKGDFEGAQAQLRAAISLGPKEDAPWIALSELFIKAQMFAEAEQAARHALDLNSRAVQAWNNLGVAVGRQGRAQEGLTAFDRALAISPDYAIGHLNRGHALKQLGRIDEARSEYQKAREIDPSLF